MEVNLQPYSNLLVKPIIHEQLENKKLLITTSPFSGENILHQTYEDKEYNLNIYPGGRSVRWTKVFTKNTTLPYRTSFTVSCYGYKSFNFIFRNESYTEVGFNEILVSYTIDSEVFTFKCPQNYGGFIGTLETTSQREITFEIVLDTYEQIGDVNSILQIGVAFTQPYTAYLKNIESQVVLKTYPVTSPHGLSVIKRNESDVFNYNESSPTEIQIIRLFQNHSDNNVIEKNIELIDVYEGYITYQGSILSPTINIKDSKVLQSNYLEFVTLGKFYYIEDIITLGKDSYQLSLKVDVLMTYKDDILKHGAYILRNEYDFNTLFFDNRIPLKSIPIIETYYSSSYPFLSFSQTFEDNYITSREVLSSDSYCVLLTCNTTMYTSRDGGLPSEVFDSNFQGFYCGTMLYCLKGKDVSNIYQIIANASDIGNFFDEKSQYVLSFQFFPFDISKYLKSPNDITLTTTLRCGIRNNIDLKIELPDDTEDLTFEVYRIDKPKCIVLTFNKIYIQFKNYNTFIYNNINSQIFLPFYGFSDIDINAFYNNIDGFEIYVRYYISLDGSCDIHISKTSTSMPIHIISFKISEDIPFTQTNLGDIKRNMFLSSLNLITNSIISGVSGMPSQTKLNLLEARATKRTTPKTKLGAAIEQQKSEITSENISKGINLVSSATIDIVKGFNNKLSGGSITSTYSKLYSSGEQTCFVVIKYNEPDINNDLQYNHYMGRPLNKYRSLSEVYGYTEVGAIHLDNLNNCLNYEKDEIEEYLKNGVYFPNKPLK